MSRTHPALDVVTDPRVRATLARLHAEAARHEPWLVARLASQLPRWIRGRPLPWARLEPRLSDLSLSIDPGGGAFCYLLARASNARCVVEFGTSFGVSTIWLALAVRENGGGVVIGTERVPEKAARARQHLREAGLSDLVDLREGDALQTLRDLDRPVDLLLNDGFPPYVLPVLRLVAPRMRSGAVALCGNAAVFPADHADYVAWVRDPANGFRSARVSAALIGELSVKVA